MTRPDEPAAAAVDAATPPVLVGDATAVLQQTTGRTLVRGAFWRLTSYLLPQFYALTLSIVAARYLGPSGMGRQSYIAFVSLSVASLAAGGIPVAVMRYLSLRLGAGDAGLARAIIRWGWLISAACAAFGGVVVAAPAVAGHSDATAWTLAAAGASIGIMNGVPWAILTSLQRWRQAALWSLAVNSVATGVTVAVLAAGYGIVGMFAVEAGAALLSVAGSTALARHALRRMLPVGTAPLGPLRRELLRYSVLATVELILTYLVLRRTELFALRRYSTNREIAFYSISFATVGALQQVPLAMQSVLMPAMATLWGAGQIDRIRSGVTRALRLTFITSLALASGIAALGPGLISALYGHAYREAGSVLMVLALAVAIVPVCAVGAAALGAMGIQRFPIMTSIVAVLVDVGLALALVPRHGAMGAAIANVSAQAVAGGPPLWYAARRLRPLDWRFAIVARGVVVPLAAGAVAGLVRTTEPGGAGVVVGATAGAVSYVLLAKAVKLLPRDDATWLADTAGERRLRLAIWVARNWSATR